MAATDFDFNYTRSQIIERAYRIIGHLAPGDSLSGDDSTVGILVLNEVLKEWQNEGVFLWQAVEGTQSISSGDATYVLNNDILSIDACRYVNGSSEEPLEIIPYRKYLEIPDKDSTGAPLCIALNYSTPQRTLYVYPTPNATYSLKYLGTQRLQDLDTSSGNPAIPQHLLSALVYKLASALADEKGIDLKERQWIEEKGSMKLRKAMNKDYEAETYSFTTSAFPGRGRR